MKSPYSEKLKSHKQLFWWLLGTWDLALFLQSNPLNKTVVRIPKSNYDSLKDLVFPLKCNPFVDQTTKYFSNSMSDFFFSVSIPGSIRKESRGIFVKQNLLTHSYSDILKSSSYNPYERNPILYPKNEPNDLKLRTFKFLHKLLL